MEQLSLSVAILASLACLCEGDEWPMEGKTPLHTAISADTVVPPLSVAWSYAAKGPITASPVIKDGIAYVGGNDGVFRAVDAATGEERWAFESDGKLLFWAPAAAADGVVVVGGCDGIIYACDAKTGRNIWKFETDGAISGGATIVDGTVYVGSMDHNTHALDLKSGKEKWRFFAVWYFLSAPVIDAAHNVLYTNAHDFMGYALDTRDGKLIWKTNVTLLGGFPNNGPPALEGNKLFMAVHPGAFRCFEAATGNVIWTVNPTGAPTSGCTVAGDKVLVGTNAGLSAYNVNDGKPVWQFKDNAPVSRCTPAVSGDMIYFCSRNGKVYALRLDNGQRIWEYATGGPIDGSPAIANGRLYVASTDGKLYCFAPQR